MKVEEHIAPAEHEAEAPARTGRSKVIIRSAKDSSVRGAVQQCMEACEWESWVPRDAMVVIKPNVCTAVPDIAAVANTGVDVTAAVCEVLLTRTRRIYVGESNHMRQNAWQAFAAAGYMEMAKRLGITLVCFSEQETVPCDCEPVGPIPLPRMILEADAFITVPVLKTHALTHFTGSLKNQWGCVPNYLDRIHNHTRVHELLPTLHRIFRPKMSLMDGILTMEGRGPVAGTTRKLDLILASRDSVALDTTAMRLVGLDPSRCRHVMLAGERKLGNTVAEQIEVDGDWARHATKFEAPPRDIANNAMFYMGQYRWFVKYILGNDTIYNPVRDFVKFLRRKKILGG